MNRSCINSVCRETLRAWYKPMNNAESRESQNVVNLAMAKDLPWQWLEEGRENPILTDMRED